MSATANPTAAESGAEHRHLLLVDDEESVLRALKRALRPNDWQVRLAPSGEAALEALAESAAQVVVSDYKMPGMTGVELLRAIKERYPSTQRIMLTGYADHRAIEDAINRSEVFRFLSKPWDDHQLRLTIASAFEQYDLQEENRRLLALTLCHNEELTHLAESLEKKVAERTALLAKAKGEWELTFDVIDRPIAMLEKDLTVVRANKAYAAMAGRPVREVPGHKCHQLLFRSDRRCEACPVGRAEPPAKPVELLAEDRSYSMSYYTGPESDRVVCVYRDTTEEQLQIRRMLQTEKLAAVGQLAAGVAHEVNNPLGGILAFTELMLRDEGRSEKDMEFLSNVEHAALRCKKIVQSLLKFSRREQAERVRIDVNRAAEEAVVIFKTQLKSKPRARFCQELSAEPLIVDGDANQVEQIVLNLLVNAVQALKEGAGTVVLKSRAVDGHAEIRVEDDGIGIAPEVRSRLFEPAFTTKPPGEGTGFGLAICWRIAESHGGTIDVESEPGKGSAFTFRVPLSQTGY